MSKDGEAGRILELIKFAVSGYAFEGFGYVNSFLSKTRRPINAVITK